MDLYWTPAFILQKSDAYEHDRILDVFTKEWGRAEVVARGTRKIDSKLNPHLGLLDELQIGIVRGSARWVLVDAQLVYAFRAGNTDSYRAGFSILEIARRLLWPDLQEAEIFEAMRQSLSALVGGDTQTNAAPLRFWARSLSYLGYQPKLTQCIACGREVGVPFGFSLSQRGIVGEECRGKTADALVLNNESASLWGALRGWFTETGSASDKLSEQEYTRIERFLSQYTAEVIPEI